MYVQIFHLVFIILFFLISWSNSTKWYPIWDSWRWYPRRDTKHPHTKPNIQWEYFIYQRVFIFTLQFTILSTFVLLHSAFDIIGHTLKLSESVECTPITLTSVSFLQRTIYTLLNNTQLRTTFTFSSNTHLFKETRGHLYQFRERYFNFWILGYSLNYPFD